MKIKEAIEILDHNDKWKKGHDGISPYLPETVDIAIETVINQWRQRNTEPKKPSLDRENWLVKCVASNRLGLYDFLRKKVPYKMFSNLKLSFGNYYGFALGVFIVVEATNDFKHICTLEQAQALYEPEVKPIIDSSSYWLRERKNWLWAYQKKSKEPVKGLALYPKSMWVSDDNIDFGDEPCFVVEKCEHGFIVKDGDDLSIWKYASEVNPEQQPCTHNGSECVVVKSPVYQCKKCGELFLGI